MDFTNKHKIGAVVIGSILLLAVMSPTIISLFLDPEESGGQALDRVGPVSDSLKGLDEANPDAYMNATSGSDLKAASDSTAETQEAKSAQVDLSMTPEQAVAEAKLGEELSAAAASNSPSSCKSSIQAYRDTLISQEKDRWLREQQEIQDRVEGGAEESRVAGLSDYSSLMKAGHEKHLDTVEGYEIQYQFMLNQHGCK